MNTARGDQQRKPVKDTTLLQIHTHTLPLGWYQTTLLALAQLLFRHGLSARRSHLDLLPNTLPLLDAGNVFGGI